MPATTLAAGVPEIVGGVATGVVGAVTVMPKGASDTLVVPSFTLITMSEYAPALAVAGVPMRVPVVVSKFAHDGAFRIE